MWITKFAEDKLLSIKFMFLVYIPGYAHPDVTIQTFVYDWATDVCFARRYLAERLAQLAQPARDGLAANPDYADYTGLTCLTPGRSPCLRTTPFRAYPGPFRIVLSRYQVLPRCGDSQRRTVL